MRDERYYQRLNQIREKYGYRGDKNPEEEMRQIAPKRQFNPTTSPHPPINNYLHNYQIPARPAQKEARLDNQPSARRHKENVPLSPHSNIKNQPERNNWEKIATFKEDTSKYNYQRPHSQRPSVSECSQYQDSSLQQLNPSNQNSSPIRKLQFELAIPNTPRQYSNVIERPSTMTPLRANKNNYPSYQDTSPVPRSYAQQQTKQNGATKRTPHLDRPAIASERGERFNNNARRQEPFYPPTQMPNYSDCGDDQGAKYNFSLNSIDKIQEKIQMALNKGKK